MSYEAGLPVPTSMITQQSSSDLCLATSSKLISFCPPGCSIPGRWSTEVVRALSFPLRRILRELRPIWRINKSGNSKLTRVMTAAAPAAKEAFREVDEDVECGRLGSRMGEQGWGSRRVDEEALAIRETDNRSDMDG